SGSGILPCGKCLSCQQAEKELHGDIHLIKKDRDKKNISIEQVREFIKTLSMSSFLNSYKIGIVKHAEHLSQEAANALLKTLEEPKTKVIIILIAVDIAALAPTIVSRSQILKFNLVKYDIIYDYLVKNYQAKRSAAKDFARLCLGRPALAVKFLENKEFRESYLSRVQTLLQFYGQDINKRIAAVGELINKKNGGQESVMIAGRILEIWQGLIRDLLLLEFNQDNLIQHLLFADELNKIKAKFAVRDLLNLEKNLRDAKKYLAANVNPKLVLENAAVNI
ncbi:MAG: hypothetical protein U9R14_03470, partial [Patescibacteria group bacterium]|nr:hypothetical protein [Patescibacteria group bacterium]